MKIWDKNVERAEAMSIGDPARNQYRCIRKFKYSNNSIRLWDRPRKKIRREETKKIPVETNDTCKSTEKSCIVKEAYNMHRFRHERNDRSRRGTR